MLSLPDHLDHLVEIEFLNDLATPELVGVEGHLLADVAHVIGLRHRHISTVIGAGIEDEVAYVVRGHRLGRTLAQVLDFVTRLPIGVASGILYAVAEAVAFLAEEGASPGVCSMGGLDAHDIFLGFDGTIELVGTGLQAARCERKEPTAADLQALLLLAEQLGLREDKALNEKLTKVSSLEEVAFMVRRAHRESCGFRQQRVGAFLRLHFADEILVERSGFGLTTIH